MEKSRFDIISDLFKLSNVISESLKLAEPLYDKSSGSDETDCKDICRNVRYSLKPLPFLLAGIGICHRTRGQGTGTEIRRAAR